MLYLLIAWEVENMVDNFLLREDDGNLVVNPFLIDFNPFDVGFAF